MFLTNVSLSIIISQFIHVAENANISFFLWLSNIPLYIPHLLYTFIFGWTFRLIPYLGYFKWCCCEHWCACTFSNQSFPLFQINVQEWDCLGYMVNLFLVVFFFFFKETLQWLLQFTFPPTGQEVSFFSTPSLEFVTWRLFFFFIVPWGLWGLNSPTRY